MSEIGGRIQKTTQRGLNEAETHSLKKIYLFSGLGTDQRVFSGLEFPGFEPVFIQWIPVQKGESLSAYARRLSLQIHTPRPVLIGLSFGGIMALEVAQLIETEKIILLASSKSRHEIPFYYRWAGFLYLDKMLPVHLLMRTKKWSYWFFGVREKRHRELLLQILSDTDPQFLKWAIGCIVRWKITSTSSEVVHIHGSADRILPRFFTARTLKVKDGGHLMTLTHPEEVSEKINTALSTSLNHLSP